MDFTFDTEQDDLRDAVRGMLERAYGAIDQRRKAVAQDPGFDERLWGQLAEMGLLGLPFDESVGGTGAGPVEVAIVAEEIGRVLAPEPFVEAVVLAGGLVDAVGTDAQRGEILAGISDGSVLAAFAHAEPGTRWSPAAAQVTATEADGGWRLTGVKEPVPNGARADVLVVSAVADGVTRLFLVRGDAEGVARHGYRTHDGARAARIRLDGAVAEPLGEDAGDRRADVERAHHHDRVPQDAQAVRRHPQHVPGADVPGRGHVRVAGARPQHRAVGRARRRRGR